MVHHHGAHVPGAAARARPRARRCRSTRNRRRRPPRRSGRRWPGWRQFQPLYDVDRRTATGSSGLAPRPRTLDGLRREQGRRPRGRRDRRLAEHEGPDRVGTITAPSRGRRRHGHAGRTLASASSEGRGHSRRRDPAGEAWCSPIHSGPKGRGSSARRERPGSAGANHAGRDPMGGRSWPEVEGDRRESPRDGIRHGMTMT